MYDGVVLAIAKVQNNRSLDPAEHENLRQGYVLLKNAVAGYEICRNATVISAKDHDKLSAYRRVLGFIDSEFETETGRMMGALEAMLENKECNTDDLALARKFFGKASAQSLDYIDNMFYSSHC